MKCDHCDKPALVHEVVIRNGKRHEVHLCEEHARAVGYLPTAAAAPVILSHVMASIAKPSRRGNAPACGTCGLTLPQFRQTGLLGCADCYDAFGETLAAIIEKEQAGHCGHVGKRPRRGGGSIDLARVRQRVLRQLEEAIAAEQYERAAKLRDQLLELRIVPQSAEPTARTSAAKGGPSGGASSRLNDDRQPGASPPTES